ncbi:MAG: helix-turn-helix transcriptional regulator [Phycisphaeraceae bacterium]|nr:helix-turn-helix transcriptional regulator [Phycisphaeraceae bacterium]
MQKRISPGRPRQYADVRTAAQFDALASPVRDQIVQVIVNQAPWRPGSEESAGVSIREVAEQLGRKPGSLYRHFEALVKAGLIRETGAQTSGGRDAMTYSARGEALRLITPARSGPALTALCRYLKRMGTFAGRESAGVVRDRARRNEPENVDGTRSDQASVSMFGWLDESQQQRLHRLLHEVADVFANARRRPGTKLIAASMLVRPVRLPGGRTGEEPDVADSGSGDATVRG